MSFKSFYNEEKQLNEDVSIMNTLFKLVGSQKRNIDISKGYMNFVIGPQAYAKILNLFSNQVLAAKQGNIDKKKKIYITNFFQGVLPKLDKLKNYSFNMLGKKIKFFSPVARINDCVVFCTNMSVSHFIFGLGGSGNTIGDIVLTDINTIPTFEEAEIKQSQVTKPEQTNNGPIALEAYDGNTTKLENVETLTELGFKPHSRQFILSVNNRAAKLWGNLVGMPLTTWVSASKLGPDISDPYGLANLNDIAIKLKTPIPAKQEQPTQPEAPVNQEELENITIPDKAKYDKYNEMIPQITDFKSEQDLTVGKDQQTKEGKLYTFDNGGKVYVYELKDGTYKLRFDALGKQVLQKYPSWGLRTVKKAGAATNEQ